MKHFCPCCNAKVYDFDSGGSEFEIIEKLDIIGMGNRHNKNCKMCPSNDRERLITIYIRDFLLPNIENKIRLLHIAPEIMLASILVTNDKIQYIKADKFDEGYFYPDTVEMDICNISFLDNEFDFMICNHVLEHVIDDIAAMKELYRVLRVGGKAILQVPISQVLKETYEDKRIKTKTARIQYFGQRNHVRIYAWDYLERLRSVGFKVSLIDMLSIYGDAFMEKNGLNKREKIILCEKPL